MSLYNQMRPSRLSDVKGQDKLIKILKENLSATGHLPNAMLFVGTRGTGKTSVAKIVAKQLNCEHPLEDGSCCDECPTCRAIKNGSHLDVLELDAASNNGVDNIRSIIDQVQYKPISKRKVIILDEVHMLSTGAFNALLKVMEEPPANVLFILCTTELHKIPATILSRCRKFQFETISEKMIMEKLKKVNEIYGLNADDGALSLVAKAAKGSMRDAESIYENFLDVENSHITEELVRETLGYTQEDIVFSILDGIVLRDPTISFQAIQHTISKGGSLSYLLEECFRILMDVITIHMSGDLSVFFGKKVYLEKITEFAFSMETDRLFQIADAFKKAYEQKSSNLELTFQGMILGLVCRQSIISDLQKRVEELETMVAALKANPPVQVMQSVGLQTAEDEVSVIAELEPEPDSYIPSDISAQPPIASAEDAEIANDLAALGFAYCEEATDVFEETENTTVLPDTQATETPAEDNIFGDFARWFSF